MSSAGRLALDDCGCCEAGAPSPVTWNRPGLPEIAFRIGTQPAFLARMLERVPELFPELGTRDDEDPSVALLDGFAVLADVLTFYQERIANEGYLRTATERRSILELARAIGYELNPGVAASTYLRFGVEDRPPPPGQAVALTRAHVPRGTKVQSMPAPGQLPQTFETSADLDARPEWNALRPRLTQPQPLTLSTRRLYVRGLAPRLSPGDRLLVTVPAAVGVNSAVLEVGEVVGEPELDRTRVDLTEVGKPAQAIPPPAPFTPPKLPLALFFLKYTPLTQTHLKTELFERRISERVLRAQIRVQRWHATEIEDFFDWTFSGGGHLREPWPRGRRRVWTDRRVIFEPVLVPAPPQVASYSPASGSTEIDVITNANVSFSRDMDPATISSSSFKLLGPGGAAVPATVSYDAASRTATLDPTPTLNISTTYTAQLTAGPTGPKDTSGRELKAGVTWSFHTAPDTTAPTIVPATRQPAPSGTGVDVESVVSVEFNEPMKPSSVSSATFELFNVEDDKRLRVEASVKYDAAATRAQLQPKSKLDYSTHYEAVVHGGGAKSVMDVAGNKMVGDATWQFVTEPRPPIPPPPRTAAFAFRERAGFFGNNAPRWYSLPKDEDEHRDPYRNGWDPNDPNDTTNPDTRPRTVWEDSQGDSYGGDKVFLERALPALRADSWALFESATGIDAYWVSEVTETSLADYALSGRSSRLMLSQTDGDSPTAAGTPQYMTRETTAHVQSEALDLAELPIDDPISAGAQEIMLDTLVLGLDEGREVMLSGERQDLPGTIAHEVVTLDDSEHQGGFTTLRFREKLKHSYVRRSLTISANVALATHGETVPAEPLGGGDGREANQRLVLRKPPLTYVSAATPTGAESTLEVQVNGLHWKEVAALYGLSPRDEAYMIRIDDDGRTAVVFGDGTRGARLPSGSENVVARYRSGIGLGGQVPAERLTLLQVRPAGIESVTNPLAASGAADPESRDAARKNAPKAVLALDRIVSLRDVEDFGRGFAGIGKAHAVALWRGSQRLIHLTVGAEDGTEVAKDSPLFKNLTHAIEAAREPSLTIATDSFAARYFEVSAELVSDGRRDPAALIADAQQALQDEFAFGRREFGQIVTAAEVTALLQAVQGVAAVELTTFAPVQDTIPAGAAPASGPLPAFLAAAQARVAADGSIEPAELLLVNPAPAVITVRSS